MTGILQGFYQNFRSFQAPSPSPSPSPGPSVATQGWFAGGKGAGPYPGPVLSSVDRITYATDTNTASARGPLSLARFGLAASTDSTTYGWFGGGYTGVAPGYKSLVDRITYATDTATATARGPLSRNIYLLAATSGVQ